MGKPGLVFFDLNHSPNKQIPGFVFFDVAAAFFVKETGVSRCFCLVVCFCSVFDRREKKNMFDFGRSKINFNISPAMTCHAF